MKILLSIKPKFVEKIFSGVKKFEYRKAIFKNKNITTVIVYASKPISKIVGKFTIKKIHEGSPDEIWAKTSQYSGISHDFYNTYFKNKKVAYAIEIENAIKYDTPKELPDGIIAPQSFCYLK